MIHEICFKISFQSVDFVQQVFTNKINNLCNSTIQVQYRHSMIGILHVKVIKGPDHHYMCHVWYACSQHLVKCTCSNVNDTFRNHVIFFGYQVKLSDKQTGYQITLKEISFTLQIYIHHTYSFFKEKVKYIACIK